MRIRIRRIDPKTHRLEVARPPHPPIDVELESRSMLLHDLAHYAVEAELGTERGFWGLLAAGARLGDLREPEALPAEVWAELMAIEGHVARLQTSFRRGESAPESGAWRRLRAAHGAWRKVRQGEALELDWPAADPRVVPAL